MRKLLLLGTLMSTACEIEGKESAETYPCLPTNGVEALWDIEDVEAYCDDTSEAVLTCISKFAPLTGDNESYYPCDDQYAVQEFFDSPEAEFCLKEDQSAYVCGNIKVLSQ